MQKLAEICVRRPVFATMLVACLTVVGGVSFFVLGVDRYPRIEMPTVSVQTVNLGATPQSIETEVTDRIEAAVNTVAGIDELRSTSTEGNSNVTITFDLSKDPDVAAQEVRSKVDPVLRVLPETADPPIVQKQDPDSAPIMAQNAIDQQLFADRARPRVDLVGGFSLAGLAGTAVTQPSALFRTDPAVITRLNELSTRASLDEIIPSVSPASVPLPEFLIGGWADSLANIARRRYPTGTVQLQMEFPFGNRTAKANLARSRIEQTQLERQRQQLEQAIEAEVRNALQAVESSNQRLASAGTARRNAQEQYDSERRRFDSGLSTVFLLLDRQTSLVTAQTLELRARADLNQAIAVFDRAIGATLQQHNVRLQ